MAGPSPPPPCMVAGSQPLRHELERVRLEGVPVGHEDDLGGLRPADAPGPAGGLPHGVGGVVGVRLRNRQRREPACTGTEGSGIGCGVVPLDHHRLRVHAPLTKLLQRRVFG